MAWTEADLALLEQAILDLGRGVKVVHVKYSDREVTYGETSLAEMLELRQTIRNGLQGSARPKQWYGRVGGQGF